MNLSQHTVTIPIADYQELMAAKERGDKRFIELRDKLAMHLEELGVPAHLNQKDFMEHIIRTIRNSK